MNTQKKVNISRQTKQAYGTQYESHLFEQYKLYVEMADRISARRNLANTFFLGVNTALLTALTALLKEDILPKSLISCIPFIAASILCFVWWKMIGSYRQLNTGKFKVIHLIEQNLPIALYDAEWEVLGKGSNPAVYRPLTNVENWVPFCFIALYLAICTSIWAPVSNLTENNNIKSSNTSNTSNQTSLKKTDTTPTEKDLK